MNNLRAYPLYLGIKGSSALFFTLWATVAAVYRIEEVHLDPLRRQILAIPMKFIGFLLTDGCSALSIRRMELHGTQGHAKGRMSLTPRARRCSVCA